MQASGAAPQDQTLEDLADEIWGEIDRAPRARRRQVCGLWLDPSALAVARRDPSMCRATSFQPAAHRAPRPRAARTVRRGARARRQRTARASRAGPDSDGPEPGETQAGRPAGVVGVSRKAVDPRYPPVAMQRAEAAWYCGVSVDAFDEHIRPNLPTVYVGALRLWRRDDMDGWLGAQAVAPATMRASQLKRPRAAGTAGGMAQGGITP